MSEVPNIQLEIADRFFADGMLREAMLAYEAILERDGDNAHAWRGLGLIAERNDDLPAAVWRMNEAMRRLSQEDGAEVARDMARLLYSQGRVDDCIVAGLSAARGFLSAQRWGEGVSLLRQMRQLRPDDAEIRVLLVFGLHSLALDVQAIDSEMALDLELEALELDPNQYAILREVVRTHSKSGDMEKARIYLDRIIAVFDSIAPEASEPKGLLDVSLSDTTAEMIAGALLSDGAVLLRGLLDEAGQAHYLSLIERRWLHNPKDVFAHVPQKIIDAMAIILGQAPQAMVPGSNVRTARVTDDQSFLYYHQDLTPLYTMGINFWAALDPIDGTRPGLEVLVRRQRKAFPVVPGHIIESTPYRIPDDLVRGVYPDSEFVAPMMAVGDGMLFLFSTVHRSHVLPEMTNPRRNAELRFI